jgi:hypothetical protein
MLTTFPWSSWLQTSMHPRFYVCFRYSVQGYKNLHARTVVILYCRCPQERQTVIVFLPSSPTSSIIPASSTLLQFHPPILSAPNSPSSQRKRWLHISTIVHAKVILFSLFLHGYHRLLPPPSKEKKIAPDRHQLNLRHTLCRKKEKPLLLWKRREQICTVQSSFRSRKSRYPAVAYYVGALASFKRSSQICKLPRLRFVLRVELTSYVSRSFCVNIDDYITHLSKSHFGLHKRLLHLCHLLL